MVAPDTLALDRGFTSPNYNARGGASVDYLIIHHTGTGSTEEALKRYIDPVHPDGRISPHYLIAEDGHIYYLIDEDKRAWHAGISCWDGVGDLNTHSIGIELAHPGWKAHYGFSQTQMDSLNIQDRHVLGHSDVAPDRKHDPGYWFPWAEMARAGLGVWPDPDAEDAQAADNISPDQWRDWLYSYGYCKSYKKRDLMYAFYQHFYPEGFQNNAMPDPHAPDKQALARLHRLMRLKQQSLE